MPSKDAAILGMDPLDGSYASSYDALSGDMEDVAQTRRVQVPNMGRMFMGRQFSSSINMMRLLGVEIDENSRIMRSIGTMMSTNIAIYSFYSMVCAYRRSQAAVQTALAVSETAAILKVPVIGWSQAWRIPLALAAAAIATASLVSFKVGENIGSGEWNFPSINVTNPSDRRTAERQLQGTLRPIDKMLIRVMQPYWEVLHGQ